MNMREKPFKQALQRDIAAAATDLKELRRLARALIDLAKQGGVPAAKEIGDSLDGRRNEKFD